MSKLYCKIIVLKIVILHLVALLTFIPFLSSYIFIYYFQYLHAAFGISDRLQNAGYWADFIHPYTGLPALNPGLNIDFSTLELPYKHTVYQVNTRRKCKVIVEKPSINTIGKQ